MSMTETVGDISVENLEKIYGDDTEPCDYEGCTNPAAWFLLCPLDRSAEPVCEAHHHMLNSWSPWHSIIFDGTCDHLVAIGNCIWEPYL